MAAVEQRLHELRVAGDADGWRDERDDEDSESGPPQAAQRQTDDRVSADDDVTESRQSDRQPHAHRVCRDAQLSAQQPETRTVSETRK